MLQLCSTLLSNVMYCMQRFSPSLSSTSLPPFPILIIRFGFRIAFYLPICHKELGPATEYGYLLTNPAGNLLRPPNGSMDLRVLRTRSLVTFMPLARRLPQIICTPQYGQSDLSNLLDMWYKIFIADFIYWILQQAILEPPPTMNNFSNMQVAIQS